MSESTVIVASTGAVLNTVAGQLPLTAHFSYSLKDPVAVAMTLVAEFEGPGDRVFTDQQTWVFARKLIDEAMSTFIPAGDGDVTCCYIADTDILRFDLTDIHGDKHALFVVAQPVVDFMAESFAMAPADLEIVDVDEAITALLAGTWEA